VDIRDRPGGRCEEKKSLPDQGIEHRSPGRAARIPVTVTRCPVCQDQKPAFTAVTGQLIARIIFYSTSQKTIQNYIPPPQNTTEMQRETSQVKITAVTLKCVTAGATDILCSAKSGWKPKAG
jgi:hypothetical protein